MGLLFTDFGIDSRHDTQKQDFSFFLGQVMTTGLPGGLITPCKGIVTDTP
jgi:hypothetical protein